MDSKITFDEIKNQIKNFNFERDWHGKHSKKDLILAIIEELGELSRIIKWKDENKLIEKDLINCKEEISDIFIYLFVLSDNFNMDISEEIINKIYKNSKKYPIK